MQRTGGAIALWRAIFRRATVAGAALAVTSLAYPVTPLSASGSLEVGVVTDLTWGIPTTDVDRTVSASAAAGARWVRANLNWKGGEPDAKGVLNEGYLASVDAAVGKARSAGMQVLMPISDGVPYWASGDPDKYADGSGRHYNQYWKPAAMADYASFVGRMVARYSAQGVHAYEVWNEPNLARFWPSGPSAADYKTMLAAAYNAIKAADPTATVVMGGLSKNDYPYLEQLYAAGAQAYFDVVAVHPYTATDPTMCWNQSGTTRRAIDAFCGLEEVREVMVARGDGERAIWLTEFGWSTANATYGVSEANQADYLTKALRVLESSYPSVRVAFWYAMRNAYWATDDPADLEANFGLLRTDFATKPAYGALKNWAPSNVSTTTTTTSAPTTTSSTTTTTSTTAPPMTLSITNVTAKSISRSSATITWWTNQPASTRVEYGTASLTGVATGTGGTRWHSAKLTKLSRNTRYVFRVSSTTAAGASAQSGTYSFRTKS